MNTQKTTYRKSKHNGNMATTIISREGSTAVLDVTTMKRSNGWLVSTANQATIEGAGRFITYEPFNGTMYRAKLVESEGRATDKAIQAQHELALTIIPVEWK
jgi:hypothetical protein